MYFNGWTTFHLSFLAACGNHHGLGNTKGKDPHFTTHLLTRMWIFKRKGGTTSGRQGKETLSQRIGTSLYQNRERFQVRVEEESKTLNTQKAGFNLAVHGHLWSVNFECQFICCSNSMYTQSKRALSSRHWHI